MVEGGIRAWWIFEGLASGTETFDSGTLVASSESSAVIVSVNIAKTKEVEQAYPLSVELLDLTMRRKPEDGTS